MSISSIILDETDDHWLSVYYPGATIVQVLQNTRLHRTSTKLTTPLAHNWVYDCDTLLQMIQALQTDRNSTVEVQ